MITGEDKLNIVTRVIPKPRMKFGVKATLITMPALMGWLNYAAAN